MYKVYYIICVIILLFFIMILIKYHLMKKTKSDVNLDLKLKNIIKKDLMKIMDGQSFWLEIYYHRKFNTIKRGHSPLFMVLAAINQKNSPDEINLDQAYKYLIEYNNMFVNFLFKECDKSQALNLLKNKIYSLDKIIYYIINKNNVEYNKSLDDIFKINKKLAKLISKTSFGKKNWINCQNIYDRQIHAIILFLKNRKKLQFSKCHKYDKIVKNTSYELYDFINENQHT